MAKAQVYFGSWTTYEEMRSSFDGYSKTELKDFPEEKNIKFAAYGTPFYEGYCLVVFTHDKKLYEVNGSHCSCYGLEDCWGPEETTKEALAMRDLHSYYEFGEEAEAQFTKLFKGKK